MSFLRFLLFCFHILFVLSNPIRAALLDLPSGANVSARPPERYTVSFPYFEMTISNYRRPAQPVDLVLQQLDDVFSTLVGDVSTADSMIRELLTRGDTADDDEGL